MAYEDESKYESKRGPHPDARSNYEYWLMMQNKIKILDNSLYYKVYDCSSEGYDENAASIEIVTDPKYVFFSWKESGRDWTTVRNFHQKTEDFKKELCNSLNFFMRKGFIIRTDGVNASSKKPAIPTRMKEQSFQALFGGR